MFSITRLSQNLASGKTTSSALIDEALARINEPSGEGARIFTKVYDDAARTAAKASDLLRQAGLARSPLEGLPVSIKDLFDVAGEVTSAGSVVLNDRAPAHQHAVVVKRLLAAGAVIIGRTNMTEFAYSGLGLNPHYGTPANPWGRTSQGSQRIPGGSSSGAAVSVSDHMAVAGIGSDTGGSIRIPAALCGLTGFKPTARRVPLGGALPLSTHLDSLGAITHSVTDCVVVDHILSAESGAMPRPVPLRGLRVVVPQTVVLDGLDTHVARAFAATLERLSQEGVLIEELPLPAFSELAVINSKGGFTAAEAWAWHQAIIEKSAERYDPRVVSRIRRGSAMSAADFIELLAARAHWIASVERTISRFDALIFPTTPIIAPPIADVSASDEEYARVNLLMLRNPTLINFLDGCALSLPCQPAGEAPVGVMLAAGAMHDQQILSIGFALEQLLHKTR